MKSICLSSKFYRQNDDNDYQSYRSQENPNHQYHEQLGQDDLPGVSEKCTETKPVRYGFRCCEIFFLVFVTIFTLQRFATLTIRDTDFKTFPSECSPWATNGCTRVVLKKDGCLRPEEIP